MKALTPNIAYHPNNHTFTEMSFQLYSFVSGIFTILTILTNGIRSLVTSLPKRNSLPNPYTLPVHRCSISDRSHDSITSFSQLRISDRHTPHQCYLNKHLWSQVLVCAENILFHNVYLFVNNSLYSFLDNYSFDCAAHWKIKEKCPKMDYVDMEMDFVLPEPIYIFLDIDDLYILYAWKYFNGRYYHVARRCNGGMLQTVITFTDPSLPSSPISLYHSSSK